jgi:hypothetical protein
LPGESGGIFSGYGPEAGIMFKMKMIIFYMIIIFSIGSLLALIGLGFWVAYPPTAAEAIAEDIANLHDQDQIRNKIVSHLLASNFKMGVIISICGIIILFLSLKVINWITKKK